LPAAGSENLAILWARSKIEALEDSRLFGTDPDAIREGVLDLALEFGLLTRYTSLVAVDRTPSRPGTDGPVLENVPSLLPAGSGMVSGFSATATGWLAQCFLALLSLAVATGMLLYLPPCRGAAMPGSSGARSPMT